MRNFAKRLMDHEAGGNPSSQTKAEAAFRACEKLRPSLAALMGTGGFRALLARALALATAEIPGLYAVQVKADGALQGVEELKTQFDADKFFEGGIVLLAHLLGLLVAFVGENLTLHLVREVWPGLSVADGLEFGKGNKNEKTK
jgi:hypothetical protein